MTQRCARCRKTADGNSYRIYYGKWKLINEVGTYSDMHSEDVFLCNACAVWSMRIAMICVAACLVIAGLFIGLMFLADVATAKPGGYGSAILMGLLTLLCFAPLYWIIKKLNSLEPTPRNGESTAVVIRNERLTAQGYMVWERTSLELAAVKNPQLKAILMNDSPLTQTTVNREISTHTGRRSKIGILFDIDELGGGFYGYKAYKILFAAVDTSTLAGCTLSDGDTSETLAGGARQYCIAIDGMDDPLIAAIKKELDQCAAGGLLSPQSRYMNETQVAHEPLVQSARIDSTGEIVQCTTPWVLEAWREAQKQKHGLVNQ